MPFRKDYFQQKNLTRKKKNQKKLPSRFIEGVTLGPDFFKKVKIGSKRCKVTSWTRKGPKRPKLPLGPEFEK